MRLKISTLKGILKVFSVIIFISIMIAAHIQTAIFFLFGIEYAIERCITLLGLDVLLCWLFIDYMENTRGE